MKTMQWLIRREYWEHKGMLVWVPLVIAALMLVVTLAMAVKGRDAEIHLDMGQHHAGGVSISMGERHQEALVEAVAGTYPLATAPLYVTLAFIVFFYSLGALFDERRDRSLLFWKSLPVSDTATVLSKALLALLLVPLGVVVLALATALVITLLGMGVLALKGTNVFPLLLSSGQFWLTPLKVVSLLPVYMLWALPTVGWLLMVSSWARSKVFLWAVGTPLLSAALLAWATKVFGLALDMEWVFSNVISRLLVSVMPGAWFASGALRAPVESAGRGPVDAGQVHGLTDTIFTQSWAALGTPNLWLGAIAGVGMILVAIWLRRRREEG